MSLDMLGTIDDTFKSADALRTSKTGGYGADGRYVGASGTPSPHTVNIQPLTPKELQSLGIGAERINDVRKIYVNDGDLYSILPSDEWSFDGIDGVFRTVDLDNRPWRNYCKAIVSRKDD
jgi:hypothetical protein